MQRLLYLTLWCLRQVSAVRTDSRRQRISYSFGRGNEDSTFDMNSQTGFIRVRDPRMLDFETRPILHLVVVAQADSISAGPPLYGYCDVWVHLQDRNDNAPRFTQQQYSASVWEGNNKGTFVMQVSVWTTTSSQYWRVPGEFMCYLYGRHRVLLINKHAALIHSNTTQVLFKL